MPPRKAPCNDKNTVSDDTQAIMDAMNAQFRELRDEISSLKEMMSSRDDCIQTLTEEVSTLKEKIQKLENLVDDEDAFVRRESLILSGTAVPPATNGEICSNVAREVLKNKIKLELDPNEISVCHRLGPKPQAQGPDTRPLTVRFCRRDTKRRILFTKRDNADPRYTLHINESLTPKRRTIMYALRQIRKAHPNIVTGCNTLEGRCYAYTKLPGSRPNTRAQDRKHIINTQDALVDFCSQFVKQPLENFLNEWRH